MKRSHSLAFGWTLLAGLAAGRAAVPRAVGDDAPVVPSAPSAPTTAGGDADLPAPKAFVTGVEVRRDVEYGRVGARALHLDLYTPAKSTGRLPCVLWIHGGGWTGGSRSPCPTVAMVARGYVTASVEYRFSQEAVFPAQIEDCKAAVRWIRANAARIGVDPARIGAAGASAGGHLAALLGVASDCADLEGSGGCAGVSSAVAAVCDVCGPSDLLDFDGHGSTIVAEDDGSLIAKLLGGPVSKERALARRASPIFYATKDDPPFLIVHGDRDDVVPLDQSRRLDAALAKAGVDSTLVVVKGAGHGTFGPDVHLKVATFFDRWLKDAGVPGTVASPPAPPTSATPASPDTPADPAPVAPGTTEGR